MKRIFKNIFQNKKGFTLLELLISASIFSITVVIGINLFFNIIDIQKRTSYVQQVQGDARYVMEEITRQLRQGYLDYEYYYDLESRTYDFNSPILAVKDLDNNRFYFKRVDTGEVLINGSSDTRHVLQNCAVEIQTDELEKCDTDSNWQTVTPAEVHVKNFRFFPTPLFDPFLLDEEGQTYEYAAHDQPKVTIIFQTETDRQEKKYQVRTNLQTTISSRVYAR